MVRITAGGNRARANRSRVAAASPLDLYEFPLSHSLLLDVVWAGLFAGAYFALRRYACGAWVLAVAIYWRSTKARDRAVSYGLWPVIGVLTLVWIASIGGPPAPGIRAVVLGNIASLAAFAWAY